MLIGESGKLVYALEDKIKALTLENGKIETLYSKFTSQLRGVDFLQNRIYFSDGE